MVSQPTPPRTAPSRGFPSVVPTLARRFQENRTRSLRILRMLHWDTERTRASKWAIGVGCLPSQVMGGRNQGGEGLQRHAPGTIGTVGMIGTRTIVGTGPTDGPMLRLSRRRSVLRTMKRLAVSTVSTDEGRSKQGSPILSREFNHLKGLRRSGYPFRWSPSECRGERRGGNVLG